MPNGEERADFDEPRAARSKTINLLDKPMIDVAIVCSRWLAERRIVCAHARQTSRNSGGSATSSSQMMTNAYVLSAADLRSWFSGVNFGSIMSTTLTVTRHTSSGIGGRPMAIHRWSKFQRLLRPSSDTTCATVFSRSARYTPAIRTAARGAGCDNDGP